MKVFRLLILACPALILGCGSERAAKSTVPGKDDGPTYVQRRAALRTRLLKVSRAPGGWAPVQPPAGVQEVQYPSGSLKLKAWVAVPPGAGGKKQSAIVFFHGGFNFDMGDFEATKPFRDAGFVVMCPMLRAENGNPGRFELLFGEADDGKAAVLWLADQPYVDPEHIYTFGHSVGGGISALLALLDGVPIKHGGSAGGLYDTRVFDHWDFTPFDLKDPEERQMRVLVGNLRFLRRRHYAYIGKEDPPFQQTAAEARREMGEGPNLLQIAEVPGDHLTCLRPAMEAYLDVIDKGVRGQ
jgi:acetyl esterase/lipase